jgi:hypothetical protein
MCSFVNYRLRSLNIVFFFKRKVPTLLLCLLIKRTVIRKIRKRAFVDVDFSQPDCDHTDDDDTLLRRNDSFVSMSGVTQPTNSYVCNLSISLGEISNLREDFRTPAKRMRGANANKIGKLSYLISIFVNF